MELVQVWIHLQKDCYEYNWLSVEVSVWQYEWLNVLYSCNSRPYQINIRNIMNVDLRIPTPLFSRSFASSINGQTDILSGFDSSARLYLFFTDGNRSTVLRQAFLSQRQKKRVSILLTIVIYYKTKYRP